MQTTFDCRTCSYVFILCLSPVFFSPCSCPCLFKTLSLRRCPFESTTERARVESGTVVRTTVNSFPLSCTYRHRLPLTVSQHTPLSVLLAPPPLLLVCCRLDSSRRLTHPLPPHTGTKHTPLTSLSSCAVCMCCVVRRRDVLFFQ